MSDWWLLKPLIDEMNKHKFWLNFARHMKNYGFPQPLSNQHTYTKTWCLLIYVRSLHKQEYLEVLIQLNQGYPSCVLLGHPVLFFSQWQSLFVHFWVFFHQIWPLLCNLFISLDIMSTFVKSNKASKNFLKYIRWAQNRYP